METRFDMDNFEQTLKEHADQFTMIPSKRVWNGVYNSLHPGSKWPSLTMLLFFLLTLVGIGPLNQSSKNYTASTLPDNTQQSVTDESDSKVFTMNTYLKADTYLTEKNSMAKVIPLKNTSAQSDLVQNNFIESRSPSVVIESDAVAIESESDKSTIRNSHDLQNSAFISFGELVTEAEPGKTVPVTAVVNMPDFLGNHIPTAPAKGIIVEKNAEKKHTFIFNENAIFDDSNTLISFLKSNPGNPILIGIEDIDNEDAGNESATEVTTLKKTTRRNSKTTWIFFATPAITTTYFTGKSPEDPDLLNATSPLIVNPRQIGNTMRYNARVGLSIGAEINHEFANDWEIVSGTQLSYSGYNILAHKVHPSFSYLYLRDDETNTMQPKKYITYYGSGEGLDEVVLHNNSIQLSIPIGIKHSVWKNNNVEIKIGTSLQPSLVVKGQAYILSSDGRNYVNDPDLMRPVNLSGEFNSSISFQREKVKWHIGPTIRYQAISSYRNIYPVNEHLIDYGIRIGISK